MNNKQIKALFYRWHNSLIEHGEELPFMASPLFDLLRQEKIINPKKQDIINSYKIAQKSLIASETRRDKMYLYEGNNSRTVIFKAKCLLLEDLFSKIDALNINVDDFLNGKTELNK